MHESQARECAEGLPGAKWPAAQACRERVGTGEGIRAGNAFKSSPEQWKTLPCVHTFDALHGTTLQLGWRACRARARAELMCLMLMLSAREGSRQFKGISGSARRLMESCQSRARARALAVISARDVVMVMAAPTPPQRAPHLALLVTAVARTSRVNGADRLRRFKAADQRSKPRGKGCRSVPEGSFTRNHRKSWESSADST